MDFEEGFDWQDSENGNPHCEWNFLNATIFQQDGGWKYVVNAEGGTREDAIFSQRYRSKDEAIVRAEEFMEELFDKLLARRPDLL